MCQRFGASSSFRLGSSSSHGVKGDHAQVKAAVLSEMARSRCQSFIRLSVDAAVRTLWKRKAEAGQTALCPPASLFDSIVPHGLHVVDRGEQSVGSEFFFRIDEEHPNGSPEISVAEINCQSSGQDGVDKSRGHAESKQLGPTECRFKRQVIVRCKKDAFHLSRHGDWEVE